MLVTWQIFIGLFADKTRTGLQRTPSFPSLSLIFSLYPWLSLSTKHSEVGEKQRTLVFRFFTLLPPHNPETIIVSSLPSNPIGNCEKITQKVTENFKKKKENPEENRREEPCPCRVFCEDRIKLGFWRDGWVWCLHQTLSVESLWLLWSDLRDSLLSLKLTLWISLMGWLNREMGLVLWGLKCWQFLSIFCVFLGFEVSVSGR